jgi:hypothetical protein
LTAAGCAGDPQSLANNWSQMLCGCRAGTQNGRFRLKKWKSFVV